MICAEIQLIGEQGNAVAPNDVMRPVDGIQQSKRRILQYILYRKPLVAVTNEGSHGQGIRADRENSEINPYFAKDEERMLDQGSLADRQ
jgi:hypothetical protein